MLCVELNSVPNKKAVFILDINAACQTPFVRRCWLETPKVVFEVYHLVLTEGRIFQGADATS